MFLKKNLNLIKILINKENLLHNFDVFFELLKRHKGKDGVEKFGPRESGGKFLISPVLKSNAYGHGILEVASILKERKSEIGFLVADSFYEAMTLIKKRLPFKILIMGYVSEEQMLYTSRRFWLRNKVSLTVSSLESLHNLVEVKTKIKIHLKLDTGMHRLGLLDSEIDEAISILKANKNINLEGLCSHFADADGESEDFTLSQIKKWNEIVEKFKEFESVKYLHLSNTAGAYFLSTDLHNKSREIKSNMMRLGLGLYGINPSPHLYLDLKSVMSVETVITSIKSLKPGESVGYNNTFVADRDMTIATIPFGYNEGLSRKLSNRGFVEVVDVTGDRVMCPILGRVSMNMCSIDVTKVKGVKVGAKVIVISDQKEKENSIENISKLSETIPWETLVRIDSSLKREVI